MRFHIELKDWEASTRRINVGESRVSDIYRGGNWREIIHKDYPVQSDTDERNLSGHELAAGKAFKKCPRYLIREIHVSNVIDLDICDFNRVCLQLKIMERPVKLRIFDINVGEDDKANDRLKVRVFDDCGDDRGQTDEVSQDFVRTRVQVFKGAILNPYFLEGVRCADNME